MPEEPPGLEIDWLWSRYVAIDVEGTASPAGQPEGLVEVAALEFTLDRPVGPMKQLVEPMQIQVTEQRRNHPALGSTLARSTPSLRLALLPRFYDWGLQPHPD